MVIHFVGNNPELYRLCHDILAETPELGHSWTLKAVPSEENGEPADLYIWDFHPNLSLPAFGRWNSHRHLFVADPEDVEALEKCVGTTDHNLLLKPLSRATLANVLLAAVSIRSAQSLREDRDELLQNLIQSNLKLEEYDQERDAFLTRAVHDLRAPLTALCGYCGLLLSEPLGPLNASQSEILRRMQSSAKRLSRMASAMVELSVGRQVKRRPDLQPGDLRDSLQQALRDIAPFADEKSITITVDLAPCEDGLYYEPELIEQLLVNLLDNACRFTPRAGLIEIRGYRQFWDRRCQNVSTLPQADRRRRISRNANSYRFEISDSGAPITDEDLNRMSDRNGGARDRSGSGLSLAMCMMIVAQHDGHIWAENRDGGPVFSFVLPLRSVDPRLPATTGHIRGDNELRGTANV
jgi:signal transduction histidine kinase